LNFNQPFEIWAIGYAAEREQDDATELGDAL